MEAKRKLKNKTEISEAKKSEAIKQLNEKIENRLSFAIKDINSVYFDYNTICINFDTYQQQNCDFEIDFYTFLSFFDTSMIDKIKTELINLIKEK